MNELFEMLEKAFMTGSKNASSYGGWILPNGKLLSTHSGHAEIACNWINDNFHFGWDWEGNWKDVYGFMYALGAWHIARNGCAERYEIDAYQESKSLCNKWQRDFIKDWGEVLDFTWNTTIYTDQKHVTTWPHVA
jgi:hypothetical protein